jgi:hypothetical protein
MLKELMMMDLVWKFETIELYELMA